MCYCIPVGSKMWHSISGLEVDLDISFNQIMDIFWNIIIIIIIIDYFKSCVLLLGKVADCSSFFQLCVKNVFTFSGIKDWKRVKFQTNYIRACFCGSGGPQIGEVTCGWSPNVSCKHDQIKMRDYMDRWVNLLPHRSRLPHLPGVPYLHVNRS